MKLSGRVDEWTVCQSVGSVSGRLAAYNKDKGIMGFLSRPISN